MNNIIEIRGLEKRYKNQRVLKGINMNIQKGKVYGLLGPNGAGKSTLLKILTGISKSNEGSINVEGEPWSRKVLNRMGSMIEEPVIYENLTAVENLRVRTTLLGIDENRIEEVLKRVKLQDTKNKVVKKFSMGMKQRLGIAVALINDPDILILDEPTNGLDPYGIAELRKMIRDLGDRGITVIVSSHILWEIKQVADRVGIINDGILCYEDDLLEEQDLEELFIKATWKEEIGGREYV